MYDLITINGANFDARQRHMTTVSFGNLSDPMTYGDVNAATTSQLIVKVPLLALSGKITVRANRLNGVSAANFTVLPKIGSITPSCASLGGELVIPGSGFNSGGLAAYVKIGSGPWRFADAQTPTSLRYRIRPGDTDGTLSVRLGPCGAVINASQAITIDNPVANLDWYIRSGGNNTNGGGFDDTVTSPGTNYADADAVKYTGTNLTVSDAVAAKKVIPDGHTPDSTARWQCSADFHEHGRLDVRILHDHRPGWDDVDAR